MADLGSIAAYEKELQRKIHELEEAESAAKASRHTAASAGHALAKALTRRQSAECAALAAETGSTQVTYLNSNLQSADKLLAGTVTSLNQFQRAAAAAAAFHGVVAELEMLASSPAAAQAVYSKPIIQEALQLRRAAAAQAEQSLSASACTLRLATSRKVALQARVDSLERSVSSAKKGAADLTNKLKIADERIRQKEADAEDVAADVRSAHAQVAACEADVVVLQEAVSRLQTACSALKSAVDLRGSCADVPRKQEASSAVLPLPPPVPHRARKRARHGQGRYRVLPTRPVG